MPEDLRTIEIEKEVGAEGQDARALLLEYQPARGEFVRIDASLRGTPSHVHVKVSQFEGRALVFQVLDQEGVSVPMEAEWTLVARVLRKGEGLVPARCPVWIAAELGDVWTEGSFFEYVPTVAEIFEARRRQIREQFGSSEDEFLCQWDAQTYEAESSNWTTVRPPVRPLNPDERTAREHAIQEVGQLLLQRMKDRGKGRKIQRWADLGSVLQRQVCCLGELHRNLLEQRFSGAGGLDAARVVRLFAEFAAGLHRLDVPLRKGNYLNGLPNSSAYLQFPEFVDLLAESGHAPLWTDLRVGLVASLATFGYAHFRDYTRTLSSYSPLDLIGVLPPLDSARIDATIARFQDFEKQGNLTFHWGNLLVILAPGNFRRHALRGFDRIEDYVP